MNLDEMHMHALLAEFSLAVRQQGDATQSGQDHWLALSVLHKRALSSAHSLKRSIDRRLAMLAQDNQTEASQLQLPLEDFAGELTAGDEAPAWPPLLALQDAALERRLLNALANAAALAARHETKFNVLTRLLRRLNEPAIVFTEYRDTLLHLQSALGLSALMLHGGMNRQERLTVIERFTTVPSRLLFATDAAGEGLNLQESCRVIINLELPWNPMRLEQRIGRVDRIGQRRAIHVFHLIARDSEETRLLSRLQRRVARARADVGGADPLGNDESRIARMIIAGEELADEQLDPEHPAEPLWTPPLEQEAREEAGRIARARAFVRAGDHDALASLEGLGPLIDRTRHWRTRAVLDAHAVLLWQLVAEDGSSQTIGSTLVAVALDDWRRYDEAELVGCVHQAAEQWRAHVLACHDAFVSTRLAREHSIAGYRVHSTGVFQAGLFDRRDERARQILAAAQRDTDRQRARRTSMLEQERRVVFRPPQLLLVLTV